MHIIKISDPLVNTVEHLAAKEAHFPTGIGGDQKTELKLYYSTKEKLYYWKHDSKRMLILLQVCGCVCGSNRWIRLD